MPKENKLEAEIDPSADDATAFVAEAAKVTDGVAVISVDKYRSYMNDNGITGDVLNKIQEVNTKLTNGMYKYAVNQISDSKLNVEDFTVKVNMPQGMRTMTVKGKVVYPNPQKPGTSIAKYGVIVKDVEKRKVSPEIMNLCQEKLEKLYNK